MSDLAVEMLEAAKVGKDVGTFVALALMGEPDPEKAIDLCGEMSERCPVERENELDVGAIAQQAIREALELRRGGVG